MALLKPHGSEAGGLIEKKNNKKTDQNYDHQSISKKKINNFLKNILDTIHIYRKTF